MTHTPAPFDMPAEDLAALLCARLCHDLVAPVSAINTALEVMEDDSAADMRDEALKLLHQSAGQASAKLEFARIAFGAGTSAPGMVETRELERLVVGAFTSARSEIVWRVTASHLSKTASRLLLNMVILGIEAALRGGEVYIEAASAARMRVCVRGGMSKLLPTVSTALEGKAMENGYDGRSIQPFYTGLIARSLGGRTEARVLEDGVEFVALTEEDACEMIGTRAEAV
ncbi:MAG: histidine phosphotransferase family protein [Robiginitomaculum sp.]|nr:histidine phosphotransferase family protein [Robiginitomaculum sp.]MDQ7076566.1 histidine phosphotransferase family protein [Robiginitomaculum sp.]